MIKKNLLIYLRSLVKDYFLFTLNIVGLSVGLAACILCFLHINYESSYDKQFANHDRIYRIVTGDVSSGSGWVKVSAPIPPLLMDDVPEVEDYTRLAKITYNPKISVRYQDRIFNEEKFFMADPSLFKIFGISFRGTGPDQIIHDPNSLAISESIARKYFGDEDPIGKTINVNNQFDFEVSAVFQDIPGNSHFDFDFIITFQNLERIFPGTSLSGNWGQFNYFAYLLLVPGADQKLVEEKIQSIKIDLGNNAEFELSELGLQSLTDIHFQDNRGNQKPSYNPKYLYIYVAVALAILIVSLINFVNLSIASSTKRIKEVGVRKVIGASRVQLILQFIAESLIITSVSAVVALLLIQYILLPITNEVLNSGLVLSFSDPLFLLGLIILVIAISFASGSYITFFVTSFQPVDALNGSFKIGSKGSGLKNLLLGIQFSISIMLILGSVFIYKQLIFLKEKDLGIETDQVLSIALYNHEAREKADVIIKEFQDFSWIDNISATRFTAGSANWNQSVWWEGQEEPISMFLIMGDVNIVETLDLKLLEGDMDALKVQLNKGEVRYLLNRAARETIGWDKASGEPFSAYGKDHSSRVYGVVENYNFRSLHHNIAPCVIVISERALPSNLLIKINSKDYQKTIQQLEQKFVEVLDNTPFEYVFLDDEFQKLYESETRTSKIVAFLTSVAIVLALLGLYGLLTFVVQERTKEMAIRKVLGIPTLDIVYLLSSNFLRLLFVANVIAIPVIWVILGNWLNSFNYRIGLEAGVFIITSSLIWLFVLLTVGFNVIQVKRIDPVEGLKYE